MAQVTDITSFDFKRFYKSLPLGKEVVRDMLAADIATLFTDGASDAAALAALTIRVAAMEGLFEGSVADATALVALSTTSLKDGSLVIVESTGALYRFNDAEAVGSQDPPETYDATDAGGVWHRAEASSVSIHDPVTGIAGLQAIPAAERSGNILVACADNGAGLKDLYWFVAGDATAEALPNIVAPTAGTGRWFAMRYLLTSSFEAAGALSGHLGAFIHENIPTINEKNNLEFSTLSVAMLKAVVSHVSGQRALVYDSGDGKAGIYKYDATDATAETQIARFGNFYSHVIPDNITHPAAGRWVREGYATDNFPSQAAAAAAAGRVMESGGVDKSQVATTIPTANLVTMSAAGGIDELLLTPAADKAAAKAGITKARLQVMSAAIVLPAGPLDDGGTNVVSVDIQVNDATGAAIGHVARLWYHTAATQFGADAALCDQATTATTGTIAWDDTVAGGTGEVYTDATGHAVIVFGHVAGALAIHICVERGGLTDSVAISFT